MQKIIVAFFICCSLVSCDKKTTTSEPWSLPMLKSNDIEDDTLSSVFHIAIGDVATNVRIRFNDSVGNEKPVLFAGFDYTGAWTRDASINVWNGAGLIVPDVAKNTLLEVLKTDPNGKKIIGGQYWDNIIWAVGVWNYYLYTGDKLFLKEAYEPIVNTIYEREKEEFDNTLNLFRGPAVYGDGISAYDDRYTATGEFTGDLWLSTIDKWAEANPTLKNPKGVGMPMMCLSTNCVYYEAYVILAKIEKELALAQSNTWNEKANALKTAINTHLWNAQKGTYYYYIDPWNKCDYQEGMGISFVLLFDIATSAQRDSIFKNIVVAPAGIPCVWPSFSRYFDTEKQSYGRHSGTIWTHIQGFWAQAAAMNQQSTFMQHEFDQLTRNTFRDKQFKEIYHPISGAIYGGLQEDGLVKDSIREWKSTDRQTWGATAYLRILFNGLLGMNFDEKGITFKPCITKEYKNLRVTNIHYREAILNIYVKGKGTKIKSFEVDGDMRTSAFISKEEKGKRSIIMTLEE